MGLPSGVARGHFSKSVQESFQPVEATDDALGVITRAPLCLGVDRTGGTCASAAPNARPTTAWNPTASPAPTNRRGQRRELVALGR
jgi:hypothetical protein